MPGEAEQGECIILKERQKIRKRDDVGRKNEDCELYNSTAFEVYVSVEQYTKSFTK